jgi:Fic family protein
MGEWINTQVAGEELPTPMVAAMAHYQFATIHPYYDGNGRSARLLTNLILHRGGYGMNGIYSLEEYYAKNLQGYYEALTVGESHNYYLGRAEADVSGWLHYFCESMADAFAKVRVTAAECALEERVEKAGELLGVHQAGDALAGHQQRLLRELDQRQKQVLSLFRQSRFVTTAEIAMLLGVQPRTALNLCKQWMDDDFLIRHGEAKRSRKYELAEKWVELVL